MAAPRDEQERLITLAEKAAVELEGAQPRQVLQWAKDEFGDNLCMTSSMADAVLSTLAGEVIPGIDVIFLDTGYHFAETVGTRDAVSATVPVNVLSVRPSQTVAEQDETYGPKLYERNPDLCCHLRKVRPLQASLSSYWAWMSGIRRDETPDRADMPIVSWDPKREMVKINPLACWTQDDVDAYVAEKGVLINPLMYDGFASIGCAPCTRRVAPGEDPRAGRWAGMNKTECGLHT
ncbi:MAG: phosphoadenylyl-sulfate reductase [Mycobacteriales bacterium]